MATPDYTQQMEWLSKEPSLLRWQIKTIAHHWQKLGYFMIFVMVVCIVIFLSILIVGYEDWVLPLMPLVVLGTIAYFFFLEFRRKVWMVYNFTPSGGEIFYWRAYPEILFKLIPILVFAIVVVSLLAAAMTGQWLIAVSGPIVIVFGLGSIAMSKNYKETMVNFTHWGFMWHTVTEAEYDIKRNVIHLHFSFPMTEERRQECLAQGVDPNNVLDFWDSYIFPTPELTEQVIKLVEKSLKQGVSLERKKVELPEVV